VYSLTDYLWMIADGARTSAYAKALRAVVVPGDRVLEVGAGFGFFSVIAARAGADHVDAVDTNPAIHLGARVAVANGCADHIAFHHRNIADVTLPQRADVLLIDVRGPTPFGSRSLEILIDARDRLLRPGGRIVARADRVMAAPARTPSVFRREVHAAHGREGLDLEPIERIVFDTPLRCPIAADDLVGDGHCWVVLDYRSLASTSGNGSVAWRLERGTTVDGLALWFEADLADGVGFSTRPGGDISAYTQMFIPFRRPIAAERGGRLRVELAARQMRENYVWSWRGWLAPETSDTEELVVDQNSLAELVLDPAAMPLTDADTVPAMGPKAAALLALLSRIDGRRSVDALARTLAGDMPDLFAKQEVACEFIATWVPRLAQLERGEL
jgi:type I protein arginine methyltransferase